ncbi:MAG: TonB-dependent receptor [Polyangiaceae bacterium]|nr:TonB-dependent receptor [Polyangiaceae bacterium]
MKLRLQFAVLFALGSFAVAAQAQEPREPGAGQAVDDLDLVKLLNVEVSTATKTAERIEDAPAVITVVTREQIERWGYQSVAEVLSHTVGFYLIDDHILPDAGVRGMTGGLGAESGLIKVMIDGRSVAYRTTSGNWLGVELIPLSSIEQIEIIRGPASALYGADAFLGVVNIITVKPEHLRPVRLRGAAGLTETHPGGQLDVVGGGQVGPFDLMLGAAGEHKDRSGLTLPPESPAPRLPTSVGTRRTALNLERDSLVLQGRLGYRSKRAGELVLSAYGSGLKRGGDFAHWAQLTNQPEGSNGRAIGTIIALQQLRLNLDGLLHASDELDLALASTYFQGGTLPQDRIELGSELFYGERNQSYRGVDSAVEARWTPSDRLNAIVGIESLYDHEKLAAPSRVLRATGSVVRLGDEQGSEGDFRLSNVGAFLSVNAKVYDPWLKLTGGVRYDRHSEYGDQLTGRLGATSRLTKTLVAKLLYGSAFKAPSPYLLYAVPLRTGDVVGNRSLLPQFVHTLEYQMSYSPDRFFSVTSGVAHSWLLDKAEFTSVGINQTARNVASQRSLSWETRADLRHYDDYTLYGSFELVHSVRDLGREGYVAELVGTENVVYPRWIGRTGALFGVPSLPSVPLELGAEGMVVGPRRAADTSLLQSGRNLVFDPYVMLDLHLATRSLYLAPGHESRFALRARNVLLARGPDPGPAGFEYPLRPAEIFLEFQHAY